MSDICPAFVFDFGSNVRPVQNLFFAEIFSDCIFSRFGTFPVNVFLVFQSLIICADIDLVIGFPFAQNQASVIDDGISRELAKYHLRGSPFPIKAISSEVFQLVVSTDITSGGYLNGPSVNIV